LSEYRYPDYEKGIYPLDKNLKINWMVKKPILSPRDKKHPLFDQINFNEI
jgi:dTDP-4-dehydrorhamnose 3,5-epimerase-like enzyme